ncbi:MAG: sortase [Clostridia bacterium]|nr:sortase [Clostridia bacterium]
MNQILVNQKVYVTPKLKRKNKFYKIQFILSMILVIGLTSYYVYSEIDKNVNAARGQNIMGDFEGIDSTIADEEVLVVALNEHAEEIPVDQPQAQVLDQFNTIYNAPSGATFMVDSILRIPAIDIKYPVLSDTTYELLKISITKFWGGEPNTVGNYCIVGHNYDGKDIFFGKLHKLRNGDIVELQDKTGRVIKYKVYDKFIVNPSDVACTSQLTDGKKEMTLITCAEGGKTRLVVKCTEV